MKRWILPTLFVIIDLSSVVAGQLVDGLFILLFARLALSRRTWVRLSGLTCFGAASLFACSQWRGDVVSGIVFPVFLLLPLLVLAPGRRVLSWLRAPLEAASTFLLIAGFTNYYAMSIPAPAATDWTQNDSWERPLQRSDAEIDRQLRRRVQEMYDSVPGEAQRIMEENRYWRDLEQ